MANFPGPYEVRFTYNANGNTSVLLNHAMRFSCDLQAVPAPGTAFNLIYVKNRLNSMNPTLQSAVDAWVVLLKAILHTSSTIIGAELWRYDAGTFDATFVSAYAINVVGTSSTASGAARQDIVTFRSTNGSTIRFSVLEAGLSLPSGKYAPLAGNADMDAIVNFLLSDNCWMIARDNGMPFYGLNLFVGQNEALFKKRFRV